jgi:hypothetical protein
MADKMTKKDVLTEIRATLVDNFEEGDVAAYVEFIDKEIAAIDARAEKEKARRAAKKAEGDALKDAVKAAIDAADGPITATAIADGLLEEYPEVTKAKVTYRASALAKDGEVDKTKIDEDGRKVVAYAPAGTVAEDEE